MHRVLRMNYVMEVGPSAAGMWVVFSFDDGAAEPKIELSARLDRSSARRELASLIRGQPARCAPSLRSFGKKHGWVEEPPSRLAREVAVWATVSVENMLMFDGGLPDARLIDAWLGACARYLAAKPWERLHGVRQRLIDVHFDGPRLQARKTVALFGDEHEQRLVIAESLDSLLTDRGPLGLPSDCLSQILCIESGTTAEAIAHLHHRPFVPRVIGVRGGVLEPVEDGQLLMLAGVTGAIASLCENHTCGRSDLLGMETLALPLELEPARPRLAS